QSVYGTRPVGKINDFPQLTGGNYGVSPDGDLLVAVQPAGDLCEIWRHETNRLVPRATHHALKNMIGIPSFSSDGRRVALLSADGAFGVWQVEPWRELARWEGEVALAHGIIFDPPGKRVFVICHDKGAVVGDI